MAQWEYLTLFLEAKVHKEDEANLKKRFGRKRLPKFTPESMIPELDQLGAAGWELVHMEPVPKVGGKGDVLFGGVRWSNQYFCVFKRPKHIPAPTSRPMAPQEQDAVTPPPPQTPNPALAQTPPMPADEQG